LDIANDNVEFDVIFLVYRPGLQQQSITLPGYSANVIRKFDAANLLSGLDLGSAVAESDKLLEAAQVETSVFDDLLADRVDLIPGTKGSGKTALYRIFVDFLPGMMLTNRKIVIAHGVQQRQDTVFLAYKKQFDQLTEGDFVDFWCIYFVSLAYEQFIRADQFQAFLTNCSDEISEFRTAYRHAGIPDFDRRKTIQEILAWALAVLKRVKPRVKWTPPENVGQLELSLDVDVPTARDALTDSDPRMPAYIDAIASNLEHLLIKANLYLWLMVDRLDELFARRSETETKALRGLLRTLCLFRSDRIRVKVFLRDDILEQIVGDLGFTALTHVTARRTMVRRANLNNGCAAYLREWDLSHTLRCRLPSSRVKHGVPAAAVLQDFH